MVPVDEARPGPHPAPPPDLHDRDLPLLTVDETWYRIHQIRYDPIHFGSSGWNRFDAPGGEYGVLYVAADPHGSFVETFGHQTGVGVVTMSALRQRGIARVSLSRPLRLVDLTGPGLARLGADNRICDGDYGPSQKWAMAIWRHPQEADGLHYRSRHDPSRFCAALFDRVADLISGEPTGALADATNRLLLAQLLDDYQFGLIDDSAG